MESCLYEGVVTHRRRRPIAHPFRYALQMLYLDLDELPKWVGSGRAISGRRWAAAALLPEDHLVLAADGVSSKVVGLRQRVHEFVQRNFGITLAGPVRLLTQLRYCGYYFSPLNLYYCFDARTERVEAIVAEVSNTPWREQHVYLLSPENQTGDDAFTHAKTFHVSPFMDMNMQYDWRVTTPGDGLRVALNSTAAGEEESMFSANLALRRRPLTKTSLRRTMLRYPMMPAQIMGAIYFQAFQLWWKKCPYFPHPKKQPLAATTTSGN